MSSYLLDTHVLLWAAVGSDRLPSTTKTLLEDPTADIRFSVVSLWEIVIKLRLDRADFQVDPDALRAHARGVGMGEVPVLGEHVLAVRRLPDVHLDPFDRLLIAQAREEGLTLLTVDGQVLAYGEGTAPA